MNPVPLGLLKRVQPRLHLWAAQWPHLAPKGETPIYGECLTRLSRFFYVHLPTDSHVILELRNMFVLLSESAGLINGGTEVIHWRNLGGSNFSVTLSMSFLSSRKLALKSLKPRYSSWEISKVELAVLIETFCWNNRLSTNFKGTFLCLRQR